MYGLQGEKGPSIVPTPREYEVQKHLVYRSARLYKKPIICRLENNVGYTRYLVYSENPMCLELGPRASLILRISTFNHKSTNITESLRIIIHLAPQARAARLRYGHILSTVRYLKCDWAQPGITNQTILNGRPGYPAAKYPSFWTRTWARFVWRDGETMSTAPPPRYHTHRAGYLSFIGEAV